MAPPIELPDTEFDVNIQCAIVAVDTLIYIAPPKAPVFDDNEEDVSDIIDESTKIAPP